MFLTYQRQCTAVIGLLSQRSWVVQCRAISYSTATRHAPAASGVAHLGACEDGLWQYVI